MKQIHSFEGLVGLSNFKISSQYCFCKRDQENYLDVLLLYAEEVARSAQYFLRPKEFLLQETKCYFSVQTEKSSKEYRHMKVLCGIKYPYRTELAYRSIDFSTSIRIQDQIRKYRISKCYFKPQNEPIIKFEQRKLDFFFEK